MCFAFALVVLMNSGRAQLFMDRFQADEERLSRELGVPVVPEMPPYWNWDDDEPLTPDEEEGNSELSEEDEPLPLRPAKRVKRMTSKSQKAEERKKERERKREAFKAYEEECISRGKFAGSFYIRRS